MPVPGADGEMDVIRLKPLKGLQKLQNGNLMPRNCNLCNDVTFQRLSVRSIQLPTNISPMHPSSKHTRAFTFIELLTVMVLITILASLAYPTFISIIERARKTQAKNDLTQIVTAVNAYYTEYGKYPLVTADAIYGPGGTSNVFLFNELRATALATENLRKIVFIQPPVSSVSNPAKAGIGTVGAETGVWYDPWGSPYNIMIDGTYDNQIPNPYTADTGAGPDPLTQGVIGLSLGKDRAGGSGNKNSGTSADDILSWQ
jgi:prepilin-type N-terminal cleavage/methylation domain-containing protein